MRNRRHELAIRILPLADCSACCATGIEQGVFGPRVCGTCLGAGLLGSGGESLPLEQALLQLRLRLSKVEGEARQLRARLPAVAPEYHIDNRRGAGGSNFVGD